MLNKNHLNGNKAFTLIGILIVVIFLSLVGAALINLSFNLAVSSDLEIDSIKALYLAEAGISHAIRELKTDVDLDNLGIGEAPVTELGDGFYMVKHNPQLFTITSTGVVNDVRRSVEISYATAGFAE
ncbi:MAG: type II secretion system protein [Candidatus Gygaella obscura]|nr:type II secretion system protein [Candidatus Gygaella obscura]